MIVPRLLSNFTEKTPNFNHCDRNYFVDFTDGDSEKVYYTYIHLLCELIYTSLYSLTSKEKGASLIQSAEGRDPKS